MTFVSQAGGEVMLLWCASYYQVFGVNLEVNRERDIITLVDYTVQWNVGCRIYLSTVLQRQQFYFKSSFPG